MRRVWKTQARLIVVDGQPEVPRFDGLNGRLHVAVLFKGGTSGQQVRSL
jgi:hypothetical protein